jgi:integrase
VAVRRRGTAAPDGRAAPPHVTGKLVPVFTGDELARLEHACAGRTFAQRREAALIAVFRATGIRLSELAGIRYDPGDPRRIRPGWIPACDQPVPGPARCERSPIAKIRSAASPTPNSATRRYHAFGSKAARSADICGRLKRCWRRRHAF